LTSAFKKIRSAIPLNQERLGVTISLGATLAVPADGPEQMVRRADELLYLSKKAGKNRTSIDGR
jgi:PleD family two-component response regulator